MKDLYTKEGFAAETVGMVISLIVGVGVAVMVLIFVGSLSGQTYELVEPDILEIGNNTGAASFTALNGTAVPLGQLNIHNASLAVLNGSNAVAQAGNYTLSAGAGTITFINNGFNNTALTATFTYGNLSLQANVRNSIASSFEALEQTGNYLPIIVLAVVISLVLVLVLSFGGMGGNGKQMNSAL